MANRETLGLIKGARAGDVACQLALGRVYLFGQGVPQSLPTAVHWLARAAQEDSQEACLLIGAHVPFEVAQAAARTLIPYYAQAFDAGLVQAGLVLAQLVLGNPAGNCEALRAKARGALDAAVHAGLPDAQWLLSMQEKSSSASMQHTGIAGEHALDRDTPLYAWLEQAWNQGNQAGFLSQGLPLARELLQRQAAGARATTLDAQQVLLLSRCAQALAPGGDAEGWQCCELAAHGGDRTAQLELGLGYARMDAHGRRLATRNGAANFKRAVRWLTQAGEQGLAEAWFVLSRIYTKPEFSQRNVLEAHCCLERAADLGHGPAQLECGMHAWRNRRDGVNNDVRAAYWLLQAQAQGSNEAEAALAKIAPRGQPGDWGQCAALHADGHLRQLDQGHPLLAARLALARCFHLSRAEALLLDLHAADQGHCLLIDISATHGRGKRRLALIRTAQERQLLDQVMRLFERVDCGVTGPEGNYRQRLYRLKCYLAELGVAQEQQFLAA
ncbi:MULTISPECIES: SEL1-like repeat protein [unclassified Janthinobacterium]|jgi:TPR repeat protein|uniref:Sel1 repeat family protein n=1 Tax=Janthinobacterium lividum TaxID=29581 RepID=A0A1E8PSS1_9BURK|nr:SEL1-like repeat protein [Janthinobacterium sp. CG_23.4]MDH6156014.1 TPR repeat protein [Janthinobacterium sp. CG_23.4]OFJ48734.1 hypothetical protein BA896_007205 [Janthinobacterium lividum]